MEESEAGRTCRAFSTFGLPEECEVVNEDLSRWALIVRFVRSHLAVWFLLLTVIGSIAFFAGYQFVFYLRTCCKTHSNHTNRFTTAVFLTPSTLFLLLNTVVFFGGIDRQIADSISFGFVAGMIVKLVQKPKGPGSVRLIVQQADGKSVDVWLDSVELTVGEARNKIAEALHISPSSRVAIESGKGTFLDDLAKPLAPLIEDSMRTTDFFGFITLLCFISVKEEDKKRVTIMEDGDGDRKDKRGISFLNILPRPEIKFGDPLTFLAKIAASPTDSRNYFNVSCVDKFAAAAPMMMQILNTSTVKLLSWDALVAETNASDASDAGDGLSVASSSHPKSNRNSGAFFKKRKQDQTSKHGKAVHNGDTVVLECGGRFMSVTRGWWMAWTSSEPRRSGAFIIEIVEKAPQTKFKMVSSPNAASSTSKEIDNVLRPGDIFRLRSVKFPDFELGLTSVKIRDEYCYLGLRKSHRVENTTEDDSWCMEVRFTMKNPNDLFTKL